MPLPTNPYQPYAKLHENPTGPGDKRPTTTQVLQDEGLLDGGLKGKVYLVTGCSAGLGAETARALHTAGGDVYMTVRESKKAEGEKIIQDIKSNSKGTGKLELIFMDLSLPDSVRSGAADFLARSPTLNVLIENAGVMAPAYSKTASGHELQMGTNHFGHFLLFQLLKDTLLSSATPSNPSRVVIVSSAGHHFSPIRFDDMDFTKGGDYDGYTAYGQSKTANIYMASSIERHYSHKNLHATSVHPGAIWDTDIKRHQSLELVDSTFDMSKLKPLIKSSEQGASTQVWAATAEYFKDKGGLYLTETGVAGPQLEGAHQAIGGYVGHTYDEEAEERLWRVSCEEFGLGYD
ncbi:hypothetical protein PRZ48_009480 [Zasmidium cellare]|uniref:NAD(P)-binding protein n=1 Tax=Zasmidium cellare TaxID=395010 RepID=A0ABR0EBT9_ZASCE|nr:hypothetical protein PRZ48_009480 [Zasmidium cellare]